uniref:Uncharacterized protein n=1 Tax=Nothobranchius furzeri TaxID=105023 RepID=A0A1A7ZII1_NOTFU
MYRKGLFPKEKKSHQRSSATSVWRQRFDLCLRTPGWKDVCRLRSSLKDVHFIFTFQTFKDKNVGPKQTEAEHLLQRLNGDRRFAEATLEGKCPIRNKTMMMAGAFDFRGFPDAFNTGQRSPTLLITDDEV